MKAKVTAKKVKVQFLTLNDLPNHSTKFVLLHCSPFLIAF